MSEKNSDRRKKWIKVTLAASILLAIVLMLIGTGASLAWFQDTTPNVVNVFNMAEFKLFVAHRLDNGTYEEVTETTKVFDDEALYEPGYTQVVYLKVENQGTIDFDYKTAINVLNYIPGTNVFGQSFNLQDYLKFGVVTADTEAALEALIDTRDKAVAYATSPLGSYTSGIETLAAGEETYMAIVVHMPEEVGNIANYRGTTVPTVKMGITVQATQVGKFGTP